MKKLMSALLTAALAASAIAPALAGPHEHGGQAAGGPAAAPAAQPQHQSRADNAPPARAARPERAMPQQQAVRPQPQRFDNAPMRVAPQRAMQPQREVQPQRVFQPQRELRGDNRAPRTESRPVRFENRPAQFENRPARFENRPARVESRPVQFENRPERFENRPARLENRPVRFENNPIQFENRPERFENQNVTAPFVQRVRNDRDDTQVPFAEVVRPQGAHFERHEEAFVAGRVVDEDDNDLFLENPAGETIVVRGWHGRHRHWHWADRDVTVPVVFENGAFVAVGSPIVPATFTSFVAPQTFTSFVVPSSDLLMPAATYVPAYGYVPDYAYVPAYSATPDYTNYAVASTLSSLLSNVLGSHSNSLANSLLTNYLASYALSSLSGSSPAQGDIYPAAYTSPLSYAYPTTCVYSDPNTGSTYYDPSCAPAATQTYYTSASAYAPAQVQGVVVGTSGSTLMVLGSNGLNPVLVNDAPALQDGLAFSGQPAVGRLINAYGFYQGNTFVATALQ
jgi:hypothetical protein